VILAATAALAATATPLDATARAAAPALLTSPRAGSPQPVAARAARLSVHPDAARPAGSPRRMGVERNTPSVAYGQPSAAATGIALTIESGDGSRPTVVRPTAAVSSPPQTLDQPDQHFAEAGPRHGTVPKAPEPPGATTTTPQTDAPGSAASSSDQPQDETATSPPATDQTAQTEDTAVAVTAPSPGAETPSLPTNPAGNAAAGDDPSGAAPVDDQQHGAPGTVEGATPGANPSPPAPTPNPQPPPVVNPSTPAAQCPPGILGLVCRLLS
jgi:hypothetical protein